MVSTLQFFGVGLGEAIANVAAAKRARRLVSCIFDSLKKGAKGVKVKDVEKEVLVA